MDSISESSLLNESRPLLLLDVDGVIIPYAAKEHPQGFQSHVLLGEEVWLSQEHGEWLLPLCDCFQVVWATGWEHDANRLIAPVLGLPQLPVIEFPRNELGLFTKLSTISRLVGNRPLAWIDDELTPETYDWARSRPAPTCLIPINPAVGLTQSDMVAALSFVAKVQGKV